MNEEEQIVADIMIAMLESYMEYVAAIEYAIKYGDMPYATEITEQRKKDWQPILNDLKKRKGEINETK